MDALLLHGALLADIILLQKGSSYSCHNITLFIISFLDVVFYY